MSLKKRELGICFSLRIWAFHVKAVRKTYKFLMCDVHVYQATHLALSVPYGIVLVRFRVLSWLWLTSRVLAAALSPPPPPPPPKPRPHLPFPCRTLLPLPVVLLQVSVLPIPAFYSSLFIATSP